MLVFAKVIVSLHKKIADHKTKSVHESIPARSNMEAKNRDIKYMHTNTEVIQYNGHPYCEVIFFDFHLTTDTMSSNYIYTRMKGKIFFALLVSIIISAGLWAATGAFPLKGVFWSQG
jgi:hypothetical protein